MFTLVYRSLLVLEKQKQVSRKLNHIIVYEYIVCYEDYKDRIK